MKKNYIHNVNFKNNQNQKRPKYGNQNDKVLRERDINMEYQIQPNILQKMNEQKQKQSKAQLQKNEVESNKQDIENVIQVQNSNPKVGEKVVQSEIDPPQKQDLQVKIQTIPKIQSLYKEYFNKKRKDLQSYFSNNKEPIISIEDMLNNSELKKIFGEFFSHQLGQKSSKNNKRKERVEKDIETKSEGTNQPMSRKIYNIKQPKSYSLPYQQQQQTKEGQFNNQGQIKSEILLVDESQMNNEYQFNEKGQNQVYVQPSLYGQYNALEQINNKVYSNNQGQFYNQGLYNKQEQIPIHAESEIQDSFGNKGQSINTENIKYRENIGQIQNLGQIDQLRRIQNSQNEQKDILLFGNKQNMKQDFDSYELQKLQELKQKQNNIVGNYKFNQENEFKQKFTVQQQNNPQQNQKNIIEPYGCYFVGNKNSEYLNNDQNYNQMFKIPNNQQVIIPRLDIQQPIYNQQYLACDQQQRIYDQQQIINDKKQRPFFNKQDLQNYGHQNIKIIDEQKNKFYEDKENYQQDENYYLSKQKSNNLAIDYQKYNQLKEMKALQIRDEGIKKNNLVQKEYLIEQDKNLIQKSLEDHVLNRDYIKNIFEPQVSLKSQNESILKRHSLSLDGGKECINEYYNHDSLIQKQQQYQNHQIHPNTINKNLQPQFSNYKQQQQCQQEYQNQYKNHQQQNQQEYIQEQKYQNQQNREIINNNYPNQNQPRRALTYPQYQDEPRIQSLPYSNSSSKKINIFNLMSNQKKKLEDSQINEGIQIFRSSKKNY